MSKMTQADKEAYFAAHWGQKVASITSPFHGDGYPVRSLNAISQITLTPLSAITDEDAIEYLLSIAIDPLPERIKDAKKHLREDYDTNLYSTDFLRSKSFAIEWRQWSVDDLISEGVLKLKEK